MPLKRSSFNSFTYLTLIIVFVLIACSKSEVMNNDDSMNWGNGQTSQKKNAYDIRKILTKFNGNGLSYEVTNSHVIITTKDLPNHTSPYWPTDHPMYEQYNGTNPNWRRNPNTIGPQNIVFTISLNPEESTNKQRTRLGPIGVARNGVVFFNQYAAGNEPLTREINSFDQWLGHPARTTYHYHIEPKWLTDTFGKSSFLGLLADGFPVYGPEEKGVTITNGDLDMYHGHVGPTEDFPEGIYHYHITAEDPYLNGNGYFGTPGNITQ